MFKGKAEASRDTSNNANQKDGQNQSNAGSSSRSTNSSSSSRVVRIKDLAHMPIDALLLYWFRMNLQMSSSIEKAADRTIKNFTTDLSDGRRYSFLLHRLFPTWFDATVSSYPWTRSVTNRWESHRASRTTFRWCMRLTPTNDSAILRHSTVVFSRNFRK